MNRQSKTKAIECLKKALDAIPDLMWLSNGSPEFQKWLQSTKLAIVNAFGENSLRVRNFSSISYVLSNIKPTLTRVSEFMAAYRVGLESAASDLQSMIEEIKVYWVDEKENLVSSKKQENQSKLMNEIFIVHGQDEGTKDTLARFITKLGLKPIILHEQPNQGRTIIEKFEQYSKVNFAIALLTPDDIGGSKETPKSLKPRTRQNVIFEFGYFLGKLGRNRACALKNKLVETPSDYDGVLYIPFDDAGAWKMKLVTELKTAGYNVDANLML
jgi:predicted nucleotide-binding protein